MVVACMKNMRYRFGYERDSFASFQSALTGQNEGDVGEQICVSGTQAAAARPKFASPFVIG